jgi:hypothetical protein
MYPYFKYCRNVDSGSAAFTRLEPIEKLKVKTHLRLEKLKSWTIFFKQHRTIKDGCVGDASFCSKEP